MATLVLSLGAAATSESYNPASPQAAQEHPYGWTHRPVLEHFTGLSCPPCMNGAHPDAHRLYDEEGYVTGQPWNYVEFHELNGGGEDDLMTDDSRDRMRYYQPGVAGTPSLEADGGYVQLGGSHGSTADANYDDMKQALEDSGNRDAIKKINLRIGSMYDGQRFSIRVEVDYLQNDENWFPTPEEPLPDDTLRGLLHVFMVEDNVTAWSKTLDQDVTTHNVFREYAIQGREFEMQPGDSLSGENAFYAEWEVPDTMIIDGEEIPIKVPINPANVFPIAVVYDTDDTDSGRNDGSENNDGGDGDGTPRALNSATPKSTDFDTESLAPMIDVEEPTSNGGKIQVNAIIEDDGKVLTGAFVVFREADAEDDLYQFKPLTINGEECEGEVCELGSGEAFAVLPISDDKTVEYVILAYDDNWTMGSTPMQVASVNTEDEKDFPLMMVVTGVAVMAIIGFAYWARQPAAQPDDETILDALSADDE